jgi:predicted Fe-S protein YdhL (DUF1289 family)
MTSEQDIARKKQLVSAAKALLSLQVGISVGCVRINKILHWLALQDDERYQVFKQFFAATIDLPIGNERLLWARAALLEQDVKLAKIETEFRPELLTACIVIIDTYSDTCAKA